MENYPLMIRHFCSKTVIAKVRDQNPAFLKKKKSGAWGSNHDFQVQAVSEPARIPLRQLRDTVKCVIYS